VISSSLALVSCEILFSFKQGFFRDSAAFFEKDFYPSLVNYPAQFDKF
jgi:hypothetical protein